MNKGRIPNCIVVVCGINTLLMVRLCFIICDTASATFASYFICQLWASATSYTQNIKVELRMLELLLYIDKLNDSVLVSFSLPCMCYMHHERKQKNDIARHVHTLVSHRINTFYHKVVRILYTYIHKYINV